MKKLTLRLLAILLLSGVTSCNDNEGSYVYKPNSNDYLPLQVGNYWNLKHLGTTQNEGIHKEIVSKVALDDHEYFLMETTFLCTNCKAVPDSVYIRVDRDNGYVYLRKPHNTWEDNWFRLNGANGDEWTYIFDTDNEASMTLTVVKLKIDNAVLNDCKAYYYNVEDWADEEYTRTLAPGIGFVKDFSEAWGGGYILKSARINGNTIVL